MDDISIDEKTVLEWTLGSYGGKVWTGFIWSRIEARDGLL